MAQAVWPLTQRKFGKPTRRDTWWLQPLAVFLALSTFIVYATWAAFQGNHYEFGPYLSPFYSPLLFGDGPHAWFGPKPGWWPAALPFSAALLILWAPGGFRFTCYYYRGAYYKAFWAGPAGMHGRRAAQVVPGASDRSRSILQNVHRYFLYLGADLHLHPDLRRDHVVPVRRRACHSASASAASCSRSTPRCSPATRSAATRCGTSSAAGRTKSRRNAAALELLLARAPAMNRKHQVFAWLSLCLGRLRRPLRRLCSMGDLDGLTGCPVTQLTETIRRTTSSSSAPAAPVCARRSRRRRPASRSA